MAGWMKEQEMASSFRSENASKKQVSFATEEAMTNDDQANEIR